MIQVPAISENQAVRLAMVFTLYVAQGLPIGLIFFAIPAWMSEADVSVTQIGSYSFFALLPWTKKFVNGFILDRYTYLPMGRRRAWLICALALMVSFLLAFAGINPDIDDQAVLAGLAFAIMMVTTIQDTAIDGMAADLVPAEERPNATSVMFGGQLIGIGLGSAVSGQMMARAGLSGAVLVVAGILAIILVAVLVIRERPNEKLLPWLDGETSEHAERLQADTFKDIFISVC